MTGVVVFVGPTLSLADAERALPGAEFLGPARRGDIARAVLNGPPTAVVLIDGLFNTVPAVVHKEILYALSKGVRVIGASSMGALRAAELWTYGMEGVGEIFRRFQSGDWESDDEVAVTHGPAESGFRVSSVALANIRIGLEEACQRTILHPDQAARIVDELRSVFYPERSWQAVYAIAAEVGLSNDEIGALKSFVAAEQPDAKRDDALDALRFVRAWLESPDAHPAPAVAAFHFEPTVFWRRLLSEIRATMPNDPHQDRTGVDYQALVREARLRRDSRELHRGAALLHLLLAWAAEEAPAPAPEDLQRALNRFRRRRGLDTADQAQAFYREQQLSDDEITLLVRAEASLDTLLDRLPGRLAALLPLELKRRGQFAEVADSAATKQSRLRTRAVQSLALEDLGLTLRELLDWYQDQFETIEGSLESHAEALGYQSVRQFLTEVMLEYQSQSQYDPEKRTL